MPSSNITVAMFSKVLKIHGSSLGEFETARNKQMDMNTEELLFEYGAGLVNFGLNWVATGNGDYWGRIHRLVYATDWNKYKGFTTRSQIDEAIHKLVGDTDET